MTDSRIKKLACAIDVSTFYDWNFKDSLYEKNNILEVNIGENTYYVNFLWKIFENERIEKCQLILEIGKDKNMLLGFAVKSLGFPVAAYQNLEPQFKQKVPVEAVEYFSLQNQILTFKMKTSENIWKFKFDGQQLIKLWSDLLEKNSFIKKKNQEVASIQNTRDSQSTEHLLDLNSKENNVKIESSQIIKNNPSNLQYLSQGRNDKICGKCHNFEEKLKRKEEENEKISNTCHQYKKNHLQLQEQMKLHLIQIRQLRQQIGIKKEQIGARDQKIAKLSAQNVLFNASAFEQTNQVQIERQKRFQSQEQQIKSLKNLMENQGKERCLLEEQNNKLKKFKDNSQDYEDQLKVLREACQKLGNQKSNLQISHHQISLQNQEKINKYEEDFLMFQEKLSAQMEKSKKLSDEVFQKIKQSTSKDHQLNQATLLVSQANKKVQQSENELKQEKLSAIESAKICEQLKTKISDLESILQGKDEALKQIDQEQKMNIQLHQKIKDLEFEFSMKQRSFNEAQANILEKQKSSLNNTLEESQKSFLAQLAQKDLLIQSTNKRAEEYRKQGQTLKARIIEEKQKFEKMIKEKDEEINELLKIKREKSEEEKIRKDWESQQKLKYEGLVEKYNELVAKDEENAKFKKQNEKLQSLIQESQEASQSQKNSWKISEQTLKDKISHEVEKNKILSQQNLTLASQVEEAEKLKIALRKERDELLSKKEQLEDEHNRFELSTASQLQQHKETMKKRTCQFEKMMVEHEKMKEFYSGMEKQLSYFKSRTGQSSINPILFHGNMISDLEEDKIFIKNEVEKVKQKSILKTKLIYFTDPFNSTSFHKYVDQIPDIVLIVKTENGMYFGGYSESPIKKEEKDKKQNKENPEVRLGILMSITNRKVFPLIKGKRPVTYDNYFMIFGNSEIRLKQGETKVFSNFGIANGFYSPQGSSINDILGGGKEREVKIVGFEVHRVFFSE